MAKAKKAPKTTPAVETDRRGTELKLGTTVAFNYSGEIDIGEIVKIEYSNHTRYTTYPNYVYVVRYEVQSSTRPHAAPSKIARKENLLAVENY